MADTREKVKAGFITALIDSSRDRIPSGYITSLYGMDTLKSEGMAIEFVTPLINAQNGIIPDLFATVLFTEHPFPWLCGEVVAIAWNYRIELTDGTIFGFTSHDQDLVIDGLTYEAATGFTPTAAETSSNLAVDNMELAGMMDSDRITPADLEAGRYDHAKITVFLCNWKNLADPMLTVRKGFIGEVKSGKTTYQAEAVGLVAALQQDAGLLYQKICRANLGDAQCQIDLGPLTFAGTVSQVYADGSFDAADVTQADGFFTYGNISFLTGSNAGLKYEVKKYTVGAFTLFMPTVRPVRIGDTFTVTAGCDHNFSTCRDRFNNYINFRGEPVVPGNDYASGYAAQGSSNTVTSDDAAKRG